MPHAKFGLTPKELAQVERGHREMMELANSPPVRMALQVGITRSINGKTYTLNEHHRWTREIPRVGGGSQQPGGRDYRAGQRQQPQQAESAKPGQRGYQAGRRQSVVNDDAPQSREPSPEMSRPLAPHRVDVEADPNNDGITDAARVGINAWHVPPPPKLIPRIDGLNPIQQAAEEKFCRRFERNPERLTRAALAMFTKSTMPGEPISFETDAAKKLSPEWISRNLSANLPQRAVNRAHFNVALHQVANAVTKRAFLQHLDTLPAGSNILVTCGGCGSGKGFALKNVPEALALKQASHAIWDSAGDQNATENPWILAEAEKRGLKVSFMYVHADPHVSWAHPEFGVVQRAKDPADGRMVDAKVFADSYVIGAKNHYAFASAQKDNPNCTFVYLANGNPPNRLDGMPKAALEHDRAELTAFASNTVEAHGDISPHVKFAALNGQTLWRD